MDKLRDKYRRDIERQSTVRVQKTGKFQITSISEKLTGDTLLKWLDERVDGLDESADWEEQEDLF